MLGTPLIPAGVKILLSHFSNLQRVSFEYILRWICEDVAYDIKNKNNSLIKFTQAIITVNCSLLNFINRHDIACI